MVMMVVMVTRIRDTDHTELKAKRRAFHMLGKCATLSYIPGPLLFTSYVKFRTTKEL